MDKNATPLYCTSKQEYVAPRLAVYTLRHCNLLLDKSNQTMKVQKKETNDLATYEVGW